MIKILVVDDHDLVRMGFVRMLADVEGFEVIGEASSGEEAMDIARTQCPDVILMDVKMPGIGGVSATKKILERNERIKVVAVTSLDDELFSTRMFQAGAAGYVTKGAEFEEVLKAINTVLNGKKYMPDAMAREMALKSLGVRSTDISPFELLSEREMETVMLTCQGKKAQEIADVLCVSPKTVNSYRYRIFEKLGINSDVELTLLALRHGIIDIESSL